MSSQGTSTGGISAYKQLPAIEINFILRELEEKIADFLKITMGFDKVQYTVCGLDLIDIILRVDKRIHYFKVFHDMDCNEGKRATLYAYWIAKFRPIMITDPEYINRDGYNNKINELFAVHYMLSALNGMGRIKLEGEPGGIELRLDNPYIKRLWYSLRFRNFTIDSIIVLADAITTDTFKLGDSDVLP